MARHFATVTGVLLLAVIHVTMSVTVQEFFPDAKANLTKITWDHAVNNQAKLKQALESDVMMIEADVVLGTLTTNTSAPAIPIMAHPPNNTSDLSLEDFIKQVTANNKKGFKLDFKTIEALEKSLPIIQSFKDIKVPVWLNADILVGPVNAGNSTMPVDAKRFFETATKLPQTLLSIGWTTRLEEPAQNVTTGKYTAEQINQMVKAIQDNKVANQSVTYPVRALYAANDDDTLKSLLDQTKANNPTLTIWSSEGDKVDASKLSKFIKNIGLDKVFVDVPLALRQQLNLSTNGAFTAKSSLVSLIASVFVALSAVKLL
jgi:hypothetical protein